MKMDLFIHELHELKRILRIFLTQRGKEDAKIAKVLKFFNI